MENSEKNTKLWLLQHAHQRLDHDQLYVQLQQGIQQLLHTCQSLKNKGLGGAAVSRAIDVITDLIVASEQHDGTISVDGTASVDRHQQLKRLLDESLAHEAWQQSAFLKAAADQLRVMRASLTNQDADLDQTIEQANAGSKSEIDTHHQIKVFVSLYNTHGSNIKKWMQLIKALPLQTLSRPVYQHEQDIKAMIASKEVVENEGYITVYVNRNMLIKIEQQPLDKLGAPLLRLKDGALKSASIVTFHHRSEQYLCQDNVDIGHQAT